MVQSSGVVDAPVAVNPTGRVTANSSTATFNGDLLVTNDGMGGDGRVSVIGNGARINGTGVITNSGLVEGGASSSGNSTYLDNDVVNNADGAIRAFKNGTAATNTQFRLSGDITNAGVMEGNDSDLYLTGASVANSGIIQSLNDGRVTFIGGTTVSDAGGTIHVSETGNMLISGTGTVVDSAGVQVDGELFLQGSGVVEAPVTVGVTGQITANSGTATLNDAVTVLNDGMGNAGTISLVANSARINGAGLITNNGLLEGGAPSSGNATYLDNALVNTADGVIRAFQNGMATGTYFDMPDSITNAGVMEADGGNLRFTTGSNLQNSGTLRAVLNSAGSKLIFTSGATVTDAGGATLVDGSWSALEVSGAANVELGTLSFTDGAAGSISGIGSVVIADTMIAEGSNLSVVSSARLSGLGVQVDGGLIVQSSAVVDAPTTINPTGQLTANSSIATFHADIEVLNDGADGYGRISLLGNSARINGTGIITNEGLIEGGAPSGGNATYLDNRLVNHADGVVRAFSDNWAANTTFQLSGNIVNEGLLEADWATLSLSGIFVDNTNGSLSAVNGGRLLVSNTFISGATGSRTTVDGDNSRLELTNSSLVGFDTLTLTNGGDVTINGTNTTLAILSPFTIGDSSVATVVSNGRLQARGTTVEAGGLLAGQGGMVISDVDVEADGLIEATSGATTIQGHVNNNADGLFHVTNSGTSMIVKGALDNALGGTVRLNSNTTALSGAGLFTNAGLLEAGAFSNNSTVTMSKELYNTGEVLATAINGATNTTFQLTNPDLTNEGLMRASGAHILIPGARVDHSGTFRAEHDSRFTFSNSAQVTNLGGVGEVDGDASELRVYSSSVVGLDSLTLTDGGDVTVNGSSSVLSVVSPFTIGDRSVGSVVSGATLESGGITVASGGLLAGQSGAVIANTTVNGGGLIQATTGTTTIRGNVDNHAGGLIEVTNSGTGLMVDGTLDSAVGGTVRLNSDTTALSGSGLFTNHGLLEAGAFTTGNTVTMSKELYNTGEVLATTINGATGTTFQLTHPDLTNAGLMRADGANMLIPGVHVSNSGTFRAENSSYLTFQSSAVVTNLGGGAEIDGNGSELQVYSSSVVDLDSLTLTDGGDVTVNEATLTVRSPLGIGANSQVWVQNNSTLNADSFTVADGGRLDLRASTGPRVNFNNPSSVEEGGYLYMNHYAELNGPGLTLDGTLEGYMMTANTPITVGPTGVIYARSTSDPSNYNQDVTVASGGLVQFNAPNASISGSGTFYNAGTIEGTLTGNDEVAALHNDLVNQEGGLVRVVPNGPATNTRLDMWGDITNEGTLQADAARLLLRGVSGSSTGLVTAINGGQVEIQEGATFAGPGDMVVDGDGSLLAIWSGAQAGFGSLDLLDRGDVMVSDAGSQLSVTAPFSIGMDSLLTVQGDAVLNSGPVGLEGTNAKLHLRTGGDANVGSLTVSNGGFVELDGGSGGSTLTVGNSLLIEETGSLSAFDGSYINGAEITVNGWFDGRQVEVNAPMLVGATGSLTSRTDAQSTYNQNVQVNAGGSVLLDYTSTRITGTGTFINAGTIEGAAPDDGGSVFMDNNITNQAGGIVRAGSAERALNTTFELAGTVDNSGMVEANGAELKITGNALLNNTGVLRTINGGAFVTDGPVINGASGSMEFASGSGLIVLAGGLNSDGILDIADNTVDIDGTLSCGSSSRLHASTGATLRLDDDFNNGSTQRNEFNLLDLTLDLDASGNALDPLLFEVAGEDLGANLGGLTDNFALGTLLISGDDEFVQLVDLFDNPLDGGVADALYVSTLEITDAESRLILNGLNVYYQNFNGNMSQIDYSLGGAFLPLGGLAIPEPTAVLLLAVGGLLVLGRQGRRRT
ncbi:MAG: hypothetical protein KAV82_10955 [Phycisphaerae bacterium]|nr:hypothetical protein [Phycisphaerae bacterium]